MTINQETLDMIAEALGETQGWAFVNAQTGEVGIIDDTFTATIRGLDVPFKGWGNMALRGLADTFELGQQRILNDAAGALVDGQKPTPVQAKATALRRFESLMKGEVRTRGTTRDPYKAEALKIARAQVAKSEKSGKLAEWIVAVRKQITDESKANEAIATRRDELIKQQAAKPETLAKAKQIVDAAGGDDLDIDMSIPGAKAPKAAE